MKGRLITGIALAVLLMACGDAPMVTGPSPVASPTQPIDPPAPVEIRNDVEPDLWSIKGSSGFALAQYDDSHIRAFIENLIRQGYDCVRVCGETTYWGFAYLPAGPDLEGAAEDVRKLLRVTAEYAGFSVLLVPTCTIRDHRDFATIRGWTQRVADIVIEKDYKHVFFEAVNEYWHPASNVRGKDAKVADLIRILRSTGRLVGTDDNIVPGSVVYNPALRRVVDFPSVHPWRNPDPTRREIKRIVDKNGGLVVFSETTAYATQEEVDTFGLLGKGTVALRGGGTEGDRRRVIREYKEACESVPGCIWFAHSIEGLHCENTEMWLP